MSFPFPLFSADTAMNVGNIDGETDESPIVEEIVTSQNNPAELCCTVYDKTEQIRWIEVKNGDILVGEWERNSPICIRLLDRADEPYPEGTIPHSFPDVIVIVSNTVLLVARLLPFTNDHHGESQIAAVMGVANRWMDWEGNGPIICKVIMPMVKDGDRGYVYRYPQRKATYEKYFGPVSEQENKMSIFLVDEYFPRRTGDIWTSHRMYLQDWESAKTAIQIDYPQNQYMLEENGRQMEPQIGYPVLLTTGKDDRPINDKISMQPFYFA